MKYSDVSSWSMASVLPGQSTQTTTIRITRGSWRIWVGTMRRRNSCWFVDCWQACCVQCQYRSQDVATSTLAFIKSHPLLFDTVDPLDGRPLFMTKDDLAASRLAVLHVDKYTLLFIGTGTQSWNSTICRIVIRHIVLFLTAVNSIIMLASKINVARCRVDHGCVWN